MDILNRSSVNSSLSIFLGSDLVLSEIYHLLAKIQRFFVKCSSRHVIHEAHKAFAIQLTDFRFPEIMNGEVPSVRVRLNVKKIPATFIVTISGSQAQCDGTLGCLE